MAAVDYDFIAPDYDRRYRLHPYPGVRACLRQMVEGRDARRVLELGCGSGEWLSELSSLGCDAAGIDPSAKMLALAAAKSSAELQQGVAEALPWAGQTFDIVFCINALHHFSAPSDAVSEAFRVLRPGGSFLSVGLDPHEARDRWFVYDYFPETFAADRARFPSASKRREWLLAAGFRDITVGVAEQLVFSQTLDEARFAGVLERLFTSQLTALSAAQYAAGIERLQRAAAEGPLRLETDLALHATCAERPA